MKPNLTIIVNSCDKYCDLWYPFFSLLKNNWPSCSYPIVLNTESLTYQSDDLNITCFQLFKNESVDWSTRLIKTIEKINTDYLLLFFDDEFIREPVDEDKLKHLLRIMRFDPSISSVLIDNPFVDETHQYLPKSISHKQFFKIPFARYNYHCANASLWRTKRLMHYLKSGESPWEFEINVRKRLLVFDKFYIVKNEFNPIKTSFLCVYGYGLVKGKWLWKNKELFEANNIGVDYSIRGIIGKENFNQEEIINEEISIYRKEAAKTIRTRFRDLLDRLRDVAPPFIHTIANHYRLIFNRNGCRNDRFQK